jgi:hypothetical protein
MRKHSHWIRLFFLATTLLLAGCNDFVSIYPLYDESTLVIEPALTGTWKSTEGDIWTFAPAVGHTYKLSVKSSDSAPADKDDEDKEWKFEAGLVELSGRLFLDLCSEDSGTTGAPAHVVARIRMNRSILDGNTLEVAWLVGSWMEERLQEENLLTHLPPAHGKTILTAPTRDLQDFFRRHAWDAGAFSADTH